MEPAGLLPLLLLWRIPIRLPPSGLSKHPSEYFYRILLLAFANKMQVLGRRQRFRPGSLPNFLEFHFKTLKIPIGLIWASMNLIKCLLIQVCRRCTFGQVICHLGFNEPHKMPLNSSLPHVRQVDLRSSHLSAGRLTSAILKTKEVVQRTSAEVWVTIPQS